MVDALQANQKNFFYQEKPRKTTVLKRFLHLIKQFNEFQLKITTVFSLNQLTMWFKMVLTFSPGFGISDLFFCLRFYSAHRVLVL